MSTENEATQANTEVATTEVTTETTQSYEATTNTNAAPTDATQSTEVKETTAENQQTEVDYTFNLPEGYTADEELAGDLKAFAKERNLSAEDAQKLADLGVKQAEKLATFQAEAWQKTQDEWVTQVKADKEIGGEKLNANIAVARSALKEFGGTELESLLESTGFGNHPAIIRAFVNIGKAMSDDKIITANGSAGNVAKDAAKTMFPNMN